MKKIRLPKVDLRKTKREAARQAGRKIPQTPADLFEPALSENAAYIARTRYAFRDENGEPKETPKELFWRVAYYIAAADRIYLRAHSGLRPSGSKTGKAGHDAKTHKKTAHEFYNLMASQSFIPNTPTLVNSGKKGQCLSACFVLPVEDDLESILKTMRDMAMIHKMGGGTGFSFSRLRPKDDIIGTSKGKTTGPVAFLQAYNDVTSQIRQGGVRRGANMGILHYTHPDVLRFAVHKVDEFSLTNFNISVTVDEGFMEKVKEDAKFVEDTKSSRSVESEIEVDNIVSQLKEAYAIRDLDLKNVQVEEAVSKLYDLCQAKEEGEGYELVNPRTGEVTGKLNAKKVFDLITKLAWQYGDPGMVLIDRINSSRANPTPNIGMIEATNPCAEQPLLPYDACTLGSINLAKFVYPENNRRVIDTPQSRSVSTKKSLPSEAKAKEGIDWPALKKAIHTAVHFLDNVLDMNEYPVAEIDEMTSRIRRIGLGVMGWADMLTLLGIGYNTQEGFHLAEKVMNFVQSEVDKASCDLAKIRSVFPAFKGSIYDAKGQIRPRNAARTTIAPTGTISLLADCSSGIEPHFALTFAKNTIEGKRLFNTNPYFLAALKKRGLDSDEILDTIEKNRGSVKNLSNIPDDLKNTFVVAGDIAPKDHVRMAAAFQKFTDNGISKTINFANEATVEDVREAYWLTYELGCRMVTIYRDGSRQKQVLEVKNGKSYYDQLGGRRPQEASGPEGKRIITNEHGQPIPTKRPTPQEAWGMRIRKKADVGYVYTSVFRDADNEPVEVFVTIGKTGGYVAGAAEVTGRLASRALKYGASLEEIASDLVGISCGTPYGMGADSVLSAFDAVGKSLVEISRAKQLQLPVLEEDSKAQALSNGSVQNGKTKNLSNGQINPQTNGESLTSSSPKASQALSQSEGSKILSEAEGQLTLTKVSSTTDQSGLATHSYEEKIIETKFNSCPDCGSPLTFAEGCKKCIDPTCGWSKCS